MSKTQRQAGKSAAAAADARNDDQAARPPRKWFQLVDVSKRPDRTWDGFRAAARLAIDVAAERDWVSAEDMCERIEHEMAVLLRLKPAERGDIYTGLHINFVSNNTKTRTPEFRIESDWGWRLDIAGLIAFRLATQRPR